MSFTQEQRVFIVLSYCESKSYAKCQEDFSNAFPDAKVPNKSSICRLFHRFRDTGSVNDRKRTGRPSVLTDDSLQTISETFIRSPKKSLRKLSTQIGLSYGSVHKATKLLKLHPYRINVTHQLQEPDKEKRMQYCHWFKTFIRNDISVLDKVFFSDEAWFHLSGYVNSQNYRIWSAENPHEFHEQPLHSQKIGVWCDVSRRRIVGPIFFSETITAERYQEIIMQFVAMLHVDERYCWLQQDGATSHTANSTIQFLHDFFDDRIISRGLWPPRSPDLSPPDFYLWGFLKDNVYNNNPHTLDELRRNIEDCISNITTATLKKVACNVRKRVDACIANHGGQFQHLL